MLSPCTSPLATAKREDFELIHQGRHIRQYMDFVLVRDEFTKSHDFSQAHYRIRTLAELNDIILGSS
jgi:hypothetical protein